MAVHIRLSRTGTTKTPHYRIVATDHRSPRGGRFIERLGTYDPRRPEVRVHGTRMKYWLSKGAQPSATVARLLKGQNIVDVQAPALAPAAAE